jgi:hypothetical protein
LPDIHHLIANFARFIPCHRAARKCRKLLKIATFVAKSGGAQVGGCNLPDKLTVPRIRNKVNLTKNARPGNNPLSESRSDPDGYQKFIDHIPG